MNTYYPLIEGHISGLRSHLLIVSSNSNNLKSLITAIIFYIIHRVLLVLIFNHRSKHSRKASNGVMVLTRQGRLVSALPSGCSAWFVITALSRLYL